MKCLSHKMFSLFAGAVVLVSLCSHSYAQTDSYSDAEATDPEALGWMQGFPPSPEKLIMQPESDFFSFPKLRWTVCHIRELMPTKR
ncbi:6-aminohexanoate hydrolase, partial [Pseudoalteromonas sp. SIMBA_153]